MGRVRSINGHEMINRVMIESGNSFYNTKTQSAEERRLIKQINIFRKFDIDIYHKVFRKSEERSTGNHCEILDIGSGNGMSFFSRLNNYFYHTDNHNSKIKSFFYVGIDKNINKEEGIKIIGDKEIKYEFIPCEISKEDGPIIPVDISDRRFDLINMSMIALHLRDLKQVIIELKRLLKVNGIIVIEDIDDELNFVSPDIKTEAGEKLFERLFEICEKEGFSGNRRTGKKIYSYLSDAGFNNIILEKTGVTSCDPYDEYKKCYNSSLKEDLCEVYYTMVYEDLKIISKILDNNSIKEECREDWSLYDNSKLYSKPADFLNDYNWLERNIKDIPQIIKKNDFLFYLGLQIYTAEV